MAGCASIPLPSTDLCVVDAPRSRLLCYNLANDYAINGNRIDLKPNAKMHVRPLAKPADVDKFTCTDSGGWAAIKTWGRNLQDKYSNCTCQ